MTDGRRIALALGGGGARGYAHIGVIEELERRGFSIAGVAGTSMGALVGGLHAAGSLPDYASWAASLNQRDVLRLLDPTLTGPGMLKAEKVLAKVTELIGDLAIEELPMPFTAVATDLVARKEVWFQRGRLDAAIRASIAIPGVMWPVVVQGRLLADGGLMNPVPVVATASIAADLTVAVSLSEDVLTSGARSDVVAVEAPTDAMDVARSDSELAGTLRAWLDGIRGQPEEEAPPDEQRSEPPFERPPAGLKTRDVIDLSLDALRSVMARYRLAGYPPDVLITIPRDACGTMEFHRAAEMIELGRERTAQALDRP